MFKSEFKIPLSDKHNENVLPYFIREKGIEGHLKLLKKTPNNIVLFRYLMDSRMGVIFVSLRKEKNEVSVEVKESLRGLFLILVLFISGLGLFLFHKASTGAFLMGMSLVYLYFIYYILKRQQLILLQLLRSN